MGAKTGIAAICVLLLSLSACKKKEEITFCGKTYKIINAAWVDCHDPKVTDLTPLSELTELKRLHLSGTSVSDLRPISKLKKIHTLDLNRTKVVDLQPIGGLTSLKNLYLQKTPVTSIAVLSRVKSLETLDLTDSKVKIANLGPLRKLPRLKKFFMFVVPVPQDKVDALRKALPNLLVK